MAALNFRAPAPALAAEAVLRCAKSETSKIDESRAINPSPNVNRFSMDQTGESAKVRITLAAGSPGVRRHYTDHSAKRAEIGGKLKNCVPCDTSSASVSEHRTDHEISSEFEKDIQNLGAMPD